MDAEHLEFDEFLIECAIRSIEGSPLEKLEKLKEQIEIETKHPVLTPNLPHESARLDPKGELQDLTIKLNYIYSLIKTAYSNNVDNNQFSRFSSRLNHLKSRLKRIRFINAVISGDIEDLLNTTDKIIEIHDKTVNKKIELNVSLEQLGQIAVPELDEKDGNASDISSLNSENLSSSRVEKSDKPKIKPSTLQYDQDISNMTSRVNFVDKVLVDLNNQLDNRTNLNPPRVHFEPADRIAQIPTDKGITRKNLMSKWKNNDEFDHTSNYVQRNLTKWNISFNGSLRGPPIKRFLFKLEHLAIANKVSSENLVTDISYVLREIAADWYWIYIERNPGVTWVQLKEDMIKRFQDRQTDDDRRHVLDSRKQRYKESFQDFYSDILSISLQFETPLSDTELMYIIRRNMRAGLQDKLVDKHFPSLEQMVQLCIAYEDTWLRTGFVPEAMCQNRRQINELDVNTDEMSNSHKTSNVSTDYNNEVCAFNYNLPMRHVPNLFHKQHNSDISQGCWNCSNSNHLFKNCDIPLKHKFCFGCGSPGVLKPYCIYCKQNSGNGKKRTGNGCTWPPKIVTAQVEHPKTAPPTTLAQNQTQRSDTKTNDS